MIKPHNSFIEANDIRLRYLEWDPQRLAVHLTPEERSFLQENDNIPIVLLHALGATADTWQLVTPHLYNKHLLIAFDLRGHGQSDHPSYGYDMETIAEDTLCGMATLGLGQVALVGHGWGARVALMLAAQHPALISHLILVDCPHVEPRHWPGMTRERFINEKDSQTTYASREKYIRIVSREMASFWSPEVEQIMHTYVYDLPDGRVEEYLRFEHGQKIREALWEDRAVLYYSKLTCPVLLVPAADQPKPGDEPPERLESAEEFAAAKGYMAEQVARAIQNCSILWMPNTSHDIQLQRPQVLAEAISNFVQE